MKEKPYKFVVRLPTTMRDRISESAQLYRRSMNSEIVARLQHSFSGLGTAGSAGGTAVDGTVEPSVNIRPLGINPHLERMLRQQLDADEEHLLQGYRQLSQEKRLALLKLLT